MQRAFVTKFDPELEREYQLYKTTGLASVFSTVAIVIAFVVLAYLVLEVEDASVVGAQMGLKPRSSPRHASNC